VRCETEAKFTELLGEEGYGIERKGVKEVAYVAKKGANAGGNTGNNTPPTGELEG
jgi:hypothetical protein